MATKKDEADHAAEYVLRRLSNITGFGPGDRAKPACLDAIANAIRDAVATEREQCAILCEEGQRDVRSPASLAEAIRARGGT